MLHVARVRHSLTCVIYFGVAMTVTLLIVTGVLGRSCGPVGTSPIFLTTARLAASAVFPKAVYCRSRWVDLSRTMKNCDPAELGSPERAIDNTPGSCFVSLHSA